MKFKDKYVVSTYNIIIAVLNTPIVILAFISFYKDDTITAVMYLIIATVVVAFLLLIKGSGFVSYLKFLHHKFNASYYIQQEDTTLDFTETQGIIYKVKLKVISIKNFTFGVLQSYLIRDYCDENVTENVIIDSNNAKITQVWIDSGKVHFILFPDKPLEKNDDITIEYHIHLNECLPILGELVCDYPIELINFHIITTTSMNAKNFKFYKKPNGTATKNKNKIKGLESSTDVKYPIKYPRRGFTHIIEWNFDNS